MAGTGLSVTSGTAGAFTATVAARANKASLRAVETTVAGNHSEGPQMIQRDVMMLHNAQPNLHWTTKIYKFLLIL